MLQIGIFPHYRITKRPLWGHLHGAEAENEGGVGRTKRLWEIRQELLQGSNGRSETQTTAAAVDFKDYNVDLIHK